MSRPRLSRNSQSTVTVQQVADLMDNPAPVTSVSAPVTSSTAVDATLANSVVTANLSASGRDHFHIHFLGSSLGAANQLSSTFGVENHQSFAWLVFSIAAKLRPVNCVLARRTFWRQSNNKCPGPCWVTSNQSPVDAACLGSGLG